MAVRVKSRPAMDFYQLDTQDPLCLKASTWWPRWLVSSRLGRYILVLTGLAAAVSGLGGGTLWRIFIFRGSEEAVAVSLSAYPEAVCLDGSPARYYWRRGSGSGSNMFLIFWEGGGFCGSDADCADRARGYYGSTAKDPKTMQLDHPFFTNTWQDNPLLWNWNHVYVRYCDGAYFSGYQPNPLEIGGGKQMFYRGLRITEAVLTDLRAHHSLDAATDVVLSGCSAGGIRVFAHADALRERLPASARVVGFPDSGFYLDREVFTPLKKFVITGQNGTELLNRECVEENKERMERCLIAEVATRYITTPIFAWQSRYDTDQRGCEMSESCARSRACVEEYGQNLTHQIHDQLLAKAANGVFLDSCSRHCAGHMLPRDDWTGQTPLQAFASWYIGGSRTFGQNETYPCKACCGLPWLP